MSRKPNQGQATCPLCQRVVPVTDKGKFAAHWEGVGLRCPNSGAAVPPELIQPGKGNKW